MSKMKHKQTDNHQSYATNSGGFFIKPDDRVDTPLTSGLERKQTRDVKKCLNEQTTETNVSKKPFDKKKYRLKKYSKKYKLEQWEEKRKKTVLRSYHQKVKVEPNLNVSKIYEELNEDGDESNKVIEENENKLDINVAEECPTVSVSKKQKKTFQKQHEKFQQIKEEKERKREEFLKKKAEREKAFKEAKKARYERSKKLSRKTKKGQPIMKYRMEMLLEKIQNSIN